MIERSADNTKFLVNFRNVTTGNVDATIKAKIVVMLATDPSKRFTSTEMTGLAVANNMVVAQ